ncbi:hypothetical protein TSAR_011656 [Trichomalopsis sarcophagae]|uniref:Uncharacterized protein n=1 Tax=Trichomalopsis sarcophagae TaxID=543379 RepID=A0A232EH26_9HYME|nr:hypothetical protein TSAR_011656 [Trichomalopsis sarcophagae]
MLLNTVQSANDSNITDRLSINCAIVESVAGSSRVKLTEETVNKRSIFGMRNYHNLCLPRSLVAAYAYAVRCQIRTGSRHNYWNLIRQNRGRVPKRAAENKICHRHTVVFDQSIINQSLILLELVSVINIVYPVIKVISSLKIIDVLINVTNV